MLVQKRVCHVAVTCLDVSNKKSEPGRDLAQLVVCPHILGCVVWTAALVASSLLCCRCRRRRRRARVNGRCQYCIVTMAEDPLIDFEEVVVGIRSLGSIPRPVGSSRGGSSSLWSPSKLRARWGDPTGGHPGGQNPRIRAGSRCLSPLSTK